MQTEGTTGHWRGQLFIFLLNRFSCKALFLFLNIGVIRVALRARSAIRQITSPFQLLEGKSVFSHDLARSGASDLLGNSQKTSSSLSFL